MCIVYPCAATNATASLYKDNTKIKIKKGSRYNNKNTSSNDNEKIQRAYCMYPCAATNAKASLYTTARTQITIKTLCV